MSKKSNHWQQTGPLYSLTAPMGGKQVKVSFWAGDEQDSSLNLSAEAAGLKTSLEFSPADALRLAGLLLNAAEHQKKQRAKQHEKTLKAHMRRKAKADANLAKVFGFLIGGKA